MLMLEMRERLKERIRSTVDELTHSCWNSLPTNLHASMELEITRWLQSLESLLYQDLKELEKDIYLTIGAKRNGNHGA